MAVTLTNHPDGTGRSMDYMGGRRFHTFKLAFDSSYPTGGEAFDFAGHGVQDVAHAQFWFNVREPSAGYVFRYNDATGKVQAYWVDTSVDGKEMLEVADTTSLATVVVDVLVIEA